MKCKGNKKHPLFVRGRAIFSPSRRTILSRPHGNCPGIRNFPADLRPRRARQAGRSARLHAGRPVSGFRPPPLRRIRSTHPKPSRNLAATHAAPRRTERRKTNRPKKNWRSRSADRPPGCVPCLPRSSPVRNGRRKSPPAETAIPKSAAKTVLPEHPARPSLRPAVRNGAVQKSACRGRRGRRSRVRALCGRRIMRRT